MVEKWFAEVGEKLDVDGLWREADLPDEDRHAWREAMVYRTKLPDDAVRLAKLGLTPSEVVAARADWRVYDPQDTTGAEVPAERIAALAALTDETMRYHESNAALAGQVRGMYLADLAARRADQTDTRWSFDRLGEVIGVSRQRARMIVKAGPRGDRSRARLGTTL